MINALKKALYSGSEIVNSVKSKLVTEQDVKTVPIVDIQRRLKAWGLYSGPLDGIIGYNTSSAINIFQHMIGVPTTGKLDSWEWRVLQTDKPFNPNKLTSKDRPLYVKKVLESLGWTSFQAAAMVGQTMRESYPSLRTDVWGDRGTSYGIGQWRKERLIDLKSFAANLGKKLEDLDLQARFIDWELRHSEKSVGDALVATKTLEEALRVAISYERPHGYSKDKPENGDGWQQRAEFARSLLA